MFNYVSVCVQVTAGAHDSYGEFTIVNCVCVVSAAMLMLLTEMC